MDAQTQKECEKQQSVVGTVVVHEFEPVKSTLGQNWEAEKESNKAENTHSSGSFPAVSQIWELIEKTSDKNVDECKLRVQAEGDQHDEEQNYNNFKQ